ncbi:MAG: hypothetical protein DME77_11640, partial [Verrucomicrobia bacterium]
VCRDQTWPTQHNDGADHDGYRNHEPSGRKERKEVRQRDSQSSHDTQADEWLSRRTEKIHRNVFRSFRGDSASSSNDVPAAVLNERLTSLPEAGTVVTA